MSKKILMIEDDETVAFMVEDYLRSEGFDTLHIDTDFHLILDRVTAYDPNVILLDVNLDENTSGFDLARQIRTLSRNIPIIFTTARTGYLDVEEGFKIGNVDYVKKPYTIRELVLHIKEMILRNEGAAALENEGSVFGNIVYFPEEHRILVNNGREITFRKNENSMFKLLFDNKGNLVSKDTIANVVWEGQPLIDGKIKEGAVNNLIYVLRGKLDEDSGLEIATVSKGGYKLMLKK